MIGMKSFSYFQCAVMYFIKKDSKSLLLFLGIKEVCFVKYTDKRCAIIVSEFAPGTANVFKNFIFSLTDFNVNNLNLKEHGQILDFNFTNSMDIQPNTVNGITPVIINITPITNYPLLLGLSEDIESQITTLVN